MGSRLISNLSSKKQQDFNALFPSKAYIKVYVESPADVGFWYSIFYPYEQQKKLKKLRFYPYSHGTITGKSGLISEEESESRKFKALAENAGENLLICLDSDYDWLLNTKIHQQIQAKKPYVFQTYSYSPENLKCYAESLNKFIVKAVNNTDNSIDLAEFLRDYSRMAYPLLLWHLYFKNKEEKIALSMKDFTEIVTITKEEIEKIPFPELKNTLLREIQEKINQKIKELANSNLESFETFIKEHKDNFQEKGLTEEAAYLFMQGHALYDFMENFLNEIYKYLRDYFQEKIIIQKILENISDDDFQNKLEISKEDFNTLTFKNKKNTLNKAHLGQEFGEYCKGLTPIKAILAQNEDFKDCFLFQEIIKDIQWYLEKHSQGLNHV